MWSWLVGKNPTRNDIPELREIMPRIAVEFERARRYERTVTVAVFAPVAADGARPANPERGGGAAPASALGAAVRTGVREVDVVACDSARNCCIVVMPEIGHDEGSSAVNRLRQMCETSLGCPVRGNLAVFPRDGWVFQDLVAVASRQTAPSGGTRLVPLANGMA